jgi:hypothetical protein
MPRTIARCMVSPKIGMSNLVYNFKQLLFLHRTATAWSTGEHRSADCRSPPRSHSRNTAKLYRNASTRHETLIDRSVPVIEASPLRRDHDRCINERRRMGEVKTEPRLNHNLSAIGANRKFKLIPYPGRIARVDAAAPPPYLGGELRARNRSCSQMRERTLWPRSKSRTRISQPR